MMQHYSMTDNGAANTKLLLKTSELIQLSYWLIKSLQKYRQTHSFAVITLHVNSTIVHCCDQKPVLFDQNIHDVILTARACNYASVLRYKFFQIK